MGNTGQVIGLIKKNAITIGAYSFNTLSDRDNYFSSHISELKEEIYSIANGQLYRYSNSTWVIQSSVWKGEQGIAGQNGSDGISITQVQDNIPNSASFTITLSDNSTHILTKVNPNDNQSIQKVKIDKNNLLVSTRKELNLIEGTNITLNVVDDNVNDRTNITVNAISDSSKMSKSVYDSNNDGIIDVAQTLNGLSVSISDLNNLLGVSSNIQSQINALSHAITIKNTLNTYADLQAVTGMKNGDAYIINVDESFQGQGNKTWYTYNGSMWVFLGDINVVVRNFSTNPINLATETIGVLQQNKLSLTGIATSNDLTSGLANKVDKITGKQLSTEDYSTIEKNKLAGLNNFSGNATNVNVSTTNFNKNLTSAENTVQKALDKIDDLVLSGGSSNGLLENWTSGNNYIQKQGVIYNNKLYVLLNNITNSTIAPNIDTTNFNVISDESFVKIISELEPPTRTEIQRIFLTPSHIIGQFDYEIYLAGAKTFEGIDWIDLNSTHIQFNYDVSADLNVVFEKTFTTNNLIGLIDDVSSPTIDKLWSSNKINSTIILDRTYLGTKQIDETNIGDSKVLSYNNTSGKIEYIDKSTWDVFNL